MKFGRRQNGLVLTTGALIVFNIGCQTLPTVPSQPLPVPVIAQRWFQRCNPGDGAATVHIYKSGELQASSELEWVARDVDVWEFEMNDPMGNTVFGAKHQGAAIRTKGSLAGRVPSLSVAEERTMAIGGERVGIKVDEVPCVFRSKFPQAWLQRIAAVNDDGDGVILQVVDAGRDIKARIPATEKGAQPCAQVTWRHHWLLHETLNWCLPKAGARTATLAGIEDYVINLVPLDDK